MGGEGGTDSACITRSDSSSSTWSFDTEAKVAITNSRNTLQSFSFASFVSSDRDSLSHTALTLRLR